MGYNIGCYAPLTWETAYLSAICDGIINEKIDVVGFTECALKFSGSGGVTKDWASYIVNYFNTHNYKVHHFKTPTGIWGSILIVSRYPITSTGEHQFLPSPRNMKVARTTLDVNGTVVNFFMTHIWAENDVDLQVPQVNDVLGFTSKSQGIKIMTGDFNMLNYWPAYTAIKNAGWIESGLDFKRKAIPTVGTGGQRPAGNTVQVDYMWMKGDCEFIDSYAPYNNANFQYSDHWPIVATINLEKPIVPLPENLTLTVSNGPKVDISWTPNASLYSKFDIQRDGVKIGSADSYGFGDVNIELGQTYTYKLQAFNIQKAASAWSAPMVVKLSQPSAPENLRVSINDSLTKVKLIWDNSPVEERVITFLIFRNGAKIDSSTVPEYTDTNVEKNLDYHYTVQAVNGLELISEQSDTEKITVAEHMGISSFVGSRELKFYPSLSRNTFAIEFISPDWLSHGRIDIININGEKVFSEGISNQRMFVDLSEQKSGVYWFKFTNTKISICEKVPIVHVFKITK
ncbi:MAG: hypothetical protein HQK83_18905 [Fibrobacteria bacterium]|nr:hypothetical protein [Fibrobacteria bacterium]